jgi:hypothetical protein
MTVVPLLVVCIARDAGAQHRHPSSTSTGASHESAMIDAAMGGAAKHDAHRLHLEYTPSRTPSRADSTRAAAIAATARAAVEKYRDVRRAEADGFKLFAPGVKQDVYHYTNWRYAASEHFRFDPAKPTSLLYRGNPKGEMELVGVMYATSTRASMEELNERVPLSIAHWHRHVNLCVPERGEQKRWSEQRNGQPLFGPASPIATRDECQTVGGRFLPNLFGWMVHANVFASDPRAVWGDEHAAASHDSHTHGH